jgi:hypothetical protein
MWRLRERLESELGKFVCMTLKWASTKRVPGRRLVTLQNVIDGLAVWEVLQEVRDNSHHFQT